MQKVKIVLGALFGDEGKGATVHWLCLQSKNPLVIKFSGGCQSGHRVISAGVEHVCCQLGAGVLAGVPTYIHENVYVDPIALLNEIKEVEKLGVIPTVFIHPDCRVTTPYDAIQDGGDTKVQKHGTCGKGIHATFMRYKLHPESPKFSEITKDPVKYISGFGHDIDIDTEFINAVNELSFKVRVLPPNEVLPKYDTLIFEGSQGLLLDMENGLMPYCTPSKVGLNGVPVGYLEDAEVYLVMRSYLTRHGGNFDPLFEGLVRKYYKHLEEPTNIDTGPQGKFKIGVLEEKLLNNAFIRHCFDNYDRMYDVQFNFVVTHMDCTPDGRSVLMANENYEVNFVNIEYALRHYITSIPVSDIYISNGSSFTLLKKSRF